jgi:hypothetical protein
LYREPSFECIRESREKEDKLGKEGKSTQVEENRKIVYGE